MTNWTKTILATAALMVAAGVASAQGFRADVPFAFQAGGQTMTPGSYQVEYVGQQHMVLKLYNRDAGTSAMVLPARRQDAPKAWVERGTAAMSFACSDAGCELNEIWTASTGDSYKFKTSEPKGAETRMAYVPLHSSKAD